MSTEKLSIEDVVKEVERVYGDCNNRKVTGKITVEIDLACGGIGSATITEKKRINKVDTNT